MPTTPCLSLTLALAATAAAAVGQQFREQPTPFAALATHDADAADLDGDGDLDLCVLLSTGLAVMTNDGTGSLSRQTLNATGFQFGGEILLGDVDGDGDIDGFVLTNNLSTSYAIVNDGTGSLSLDPSGLPPMPVERAALADFDGNGELDLMVFPVFSSASLLLQHGGTFSASPGALPNQLHVVPSTVCVFDADEDGDLDVLSGDGSTLKYWLNDGTGRFADGAAMFANLPSPRAAVAGDFDDDGILDLVTSNITGNLYFAGLGTGGFAPDRALTTLTPLAHMIALDADRDGDLDIAGAPAVSVQNGALVLWLNDGTGQFTDRSGARLGTFATGSSRVLAFDLEGDGDADLVTTSDGVSTRTPTPRLLINHDVQLTASAAPALGQHLRLHCARRPGYGTDYSLGLALLGPPSPSPLPTPFGAIYLEPTLAIALSPIAVAPSTGEGSITVPIPNDPSLVGVRTMAQALVVEPFGPGAPELTGAVSFTIR